MRWRDFVALLFLTVVSVALTDVAFEVWASYQDEKALLVRVQSEQAEAAAAKIAQFIEEIKRQLEWTMQLLGPGATPENRRFDALRLLRQAPAIFDLAILDGDGREQLRVSRRALDVVGSLADFSKDPKFTEAMEHKVYYGPVYFRRGSEPYMTLSLAGTRRDIGVIVAEVNLKFIWYVISHIKVGEQGKVYLVDEQGRLIADPDLSVVLRNTDLSSLAQVRAARASSAYGTEYPVTEATDPSGRRVLSAYAPVAPLTWTVFVELPLDHTYAPLYASMQRFGALLAVVLMLAAIAGLFLAWGLRAWARRATNGASRKPSVVIWPCRAGSLGQRKHRPVNTGGTIVMVGQHSPTSFESRRRHLHRRVRARRNLLRIACNMGLDGIVSKRRDRTYLLQHYWRSPECRSPAPPPFEIARRNSK
jgi:hypothetical protein